MSQPKNWPSALPYLKAPLHSKELTPAHLAALRARPSSSSSDTSSGSSSMPIMPASETPIPCPRVRIQAIQLPSHPAHGQHGLFATQHLKPGSLILAYLGRVHGSTGAAAASDYDLWLDRDADVAVDAARQGNEARFVNDFRGIGPRANAEFRSVFCERWGQVCVGVWVLGTGTGTTGKRKGKSKKGGAVAAGGRRSGDGGIRKGEEILVSYGKGFWEERRREMEGSGAEDGGGG